MTTIDFSKNGGYRLKQPTFAKMQAAYKEILAALVTVLGLTDTGKYIISGCQISGLNITPGIMYIDGELCSFAGSAGSLTTKIKKNVLLESLAFKDGSNQQVFRTTNAIVDPSGDALSTFVRATPVLDPDYVHTDNNFTALLLSKLNSIETGAEVNVQSDYNETNTSSDAYIKNMPVFLPVLKYADAFLGNFPSPSGAATTQTRTIPFPDIGTTDYYVLAFLKSLSPTGLAGQNAVPVITGNYATDSFDIIAKEFDSTPKNVQLIYIIFKKPV